MRGLKFGERSISFAKVRFKWPSCTWQWRERERGKEIRWDRVRGGEDFLGTRGAIVL